MNDEILVKCFMDGFLFNSNLYKAFLKDYTDEEKKEYYEAAKAFARIYVRKYLDETP